MASKKIGLVLALDKDTEFRNALKACKEEVKAYKDSIKDLDDKMKDNEATMDDLKKKQEDLTKQEEAYRKQLDAAKTGLEKANDSYKQQADRLNELRQKLKDAEEAQKAMKDRGEEGTEAYQKQTEEVNKLRDAIDKQVANVTTAEQKVNSWTREVKNAENGLKECGESLEQNAKDMQELGNQADGTGRDMNEFADNVDEASDASGELSVSIGDMVKNKIIDLAGDALKALGEKAIEAAKYMVEAGSSFEAQMDKVGAISGASASDMEKLTEKAKEMGSTTKFSATESGEALEYMAMAGWKTNDMVNGLEGIMNLAAASGEDLATTSDIVTDALTAFGKSAEDSGRLADIMAAASSNANTNVAMMGETFKYAAPVAGALGFSMEDTSVAIGLMANAGIKASSAGTALRAGLTNLVKPTDKIAEAMKEYGISITDSSGNMLSMREVMEMLREKLGGLSESEQAAAAATIFGKNAMSGWLAIINASDEDFNKLTAAVDNSAGAAERMAGIMQDNLSGKIVILQSALEGLAIAIYEKISGPLQDLVEIATNVISGITDLISPQRDELDRFASSIKATNDQLVTSIEHAKSTVSNAEARVGEMTIYQDTLNGILDKCEEFNYVDLGNGKYQILDATGTVVEEGFKSVDDAASTTEEILAKWASDGLNTDGIASSSEDAQNMIGYVAEKADTVEERLKKFAEDGIDVSGVENGKQALIQIFDEMGLEVESFETDISQAGAIEMDTSGVEEGTSVMITYLNDTTGEVETFKGSLADLGSGQIDLSKVSTEFDKVEDSVKRTYVITDEFTRAEIDAMVNNLGDSVEGLAAAWNSQTGELTASRDELEKWFDTAKEVAMYDALESSLHELYDAWGEAAVNVAKAQSNLNAQLERYNENHGTTYKNFEEMADVVSFGFDREARAVRDAKVALDEANTTLATAGEEIDTTGAMLEEFKGAMDNAKQSTEEAGVSAEQAAQNLTALEEAEEDTAEATETLAVYQQAAIDKYQALFGATDEYLEKQNELTATDLADWCEEQVIKYLDEIIQRFADLAQSVADSMQSYATSMETANEEGETSLQAMIDSLNQHQEEVRQWAREMEILGKETSNGFSQALYDELLAEGPERGREKVHALVEAMENERPLFDELSREYDESMAITASAESLASYSSAGKEYNWAMSCGWDEANSEFKSAVENDVREAADIASNEAEGFSEAGEKGGTRTKEGIEQTSAEVENAVEEMVSKAREAAEQVAIDFFVTGQLIPQKLADGVKIAKQWSDQAMERVLNSMTDTLSNSMGMFEQSGQDAMTNLANGIQATSYSVTQEIEGLVNDAANSVNQMQYDFSNAGSNASYSLADGILANSGSVSNAASSTAQEAYNSLNGYTYSFQDIGYSMMVGLTNGIYSGSSLAINAAVTVATNALISAKNALGVASPSKEFRKIGEFTMEGLKLGIEDGSQLALESMTDAVESLKDVADIESGTIGVNLKTEASSFISDDFSGGMRAMVKSVADGLEAMGKSGMVQVGTLGEQTKALKDSMETTGLQAGAFFASLADGAEKAFQGAVALQELESSMNNAQNSFMDMATVISGLLDQMTALSRAVSTMDVNPSVSVQIGNRAIDSYIAKASINGMAQSQKNLYASQGWG